MSDDARDIRDFLQAEADRTPQPSGVRPVTVRRARLKRAGFLASSVMGVAILAGGIAVGVTNIDGEGSPPPPAGDEDAAPEDLNPRGTAEIDVGQFPRAVEVGEGYVWVTVQDPDPEKSGLVRVDSATNEIVDTLPLEWAGDLAFGAGAVWVVSHDLDTKDAGKAATYRGSRLLRIDPQTNSVTDAIALDCMYDRNSLDCFPRDVAASESAVWFTMYSSSSREGEVVRVDPLSNEIVARIPIEQGDARDIVVAGVSVWVNSDSDVKGDVVAGGSFVRVDPRTNQVVDGLLPNGFHLGGDDFPPVMAADVNDLWVVEPQARRRADAKERGGFADESGGEEVFVRIDAGTGEIIARSSVNLPGAYPLAVGEGGMWFYSAGAVGRLNPDGMNVDHSVDIGDPEGAIVDGTLDATTGTIWVASYEGPVIRVDLR